MLYVGSRQQDLCMYLWSSTWWSCWGWWWVSSVWRMGWACLHPVHSGCLWWSGYLGWRLHCPAGWTECSLVPSGNYRTTWPRINQTCFCDEICIHLSKKWMGKGLYLEREWLPSWYMCGLYWAMIVMVSHCWPMMSRACCSVALRRFIPLYWGKETKMNVSYTMHISIWHDMQLYWSHKKKKKDIVFLLIFSACSWAVT